MLLYKVDVKAKKNQASSLNLVKEETGMGQFKWLPLRDWFDLLLLAVKLALLATELKLQSR